MNKPHEDILLKILNLISNADSSLNDCENERATAMRMVHAMLAKHGTPSSEALTDEERDEQLGAMRRSEHTMETRFIWELGVWNELARLNGCYAVKSRESKRIWIIGRAVQAEVVKSIAAWVVSSIRRESVTNGCDEHERVRFGNGAWHGVIDQVRDTLARRMMVAGDNMDDEKLSTGAALVLVGQHRASLVEAKNAARDMFGGLGKGGNHRSRQDGVYEHGHTYGRGMGLSTQIEVSLIPVK